MIAHKRPFSSRLAAPLAAWLLVSLAAKPEAFCADVELATGTAYGTAYGAALEARVSASAEAVGRVLAARACGSGAAAIGLGSAEPSSEASIAAEASATAGAFVALASVEGAFASGAAFDAGGGPAWSFASALALSLNGPRISGSLAPRVAWASGAEGRTELGGKLEISASAGATVLKPRADLSWTALPRPILVSGLPRLSLRRRRLQAELALVGSYPRRDALRPVALRRDREPPFF
jgi:hypothetical protein